MRFRLFHFLRRVMMVGVGLTGLLVLVPAVHAASMPKRPNLLFILTDDQRWDAMSVVQREQGEAGRFPWLETPAMDRLAAGGVRFRQAFDTLSLCSPSRAALLTGLYNHVNGITTNQRPFGPEQVSHAALLRDAGYRTAYIGKWHMGKQSGKRPGFDHSVSFVGQGHYMDCDFEVDGALRSTKGWVDDVSTDFAIDWLRQQGDVPFMMVLGYKSPHSPRGGDNLPPRLRDLHADAVSRPVPNLDRLPVFRKADLKTGVYGKGLADAKVHRDYMRHVIGVDQNLGRLLDALDELKLSEDTVVIYSSDNGYILGEHRSGDKRSAYEESIRIPLLVRYPKLFPAGKTVDSMVLNIDLAPTLLDLAGVKAPEEMQGRSWKLLAAGDEVAAAKWRRSFLIQYYKELGDVPTFYGLRSETHKLVVYPGRPEWTELFDLQADPYEMKNLAADEALLKGCREQLDRLVDEYRYPIPKDTLDPGPRLKTVN